MTKTKTAPKIEDRGLRLIGAIAETPRARVTGAVLADHHRTAGRQLHAAGLLDRVADEPAATSLADHDDEPVNLTLSPEHSSYGYFSPRAGWIAPEPEDVAVFALKFDTLFATLLDGLDCSLAVRPVALVPDLLWEVGHARLPGRSARVPIWVARRLSDPAVWQGLLEQTKHRPAPDLRIVLSLTPQCSIPKDFIREHEIVAVDSVIDHEHGLRIDPAILAARLVHGRDDGAPLRMAADGASITVRDKTYAFRGSKQRAVIRELYEAWRAGQPERLTAEVLETAGFSPSVNTLAKAFSGRNDWREFIQESGGCCGIFL